VYSGNPDHSGYSCKPHFSESGIIVVFICPAALTGFIIGRVSCSLKKDSTTPGTIGCFISILDETLGGLRVKAARKSFAHKIFQNQQLFK
jgi:hypothetical protein